MTTVAIFRGISGSGKSSLVKALTGKDYLWENHPDALTLDVPWVAFIKALKEETKGLDPVVCSADHYFEKEDGSYQFDAGQLPHAHGACMVKYVEAVRKARVDEFIIVDNTNCSIAEVAPYIAVATAYGLYPKVITLLADPQVCLERNKHGVPLKSLLGQDRNLNKSLENWPPWWNDEIFNMR